jgi:hypothetical protein
LWLWQPPTLTLTHHWHQDTEHSGSVAHAAPNDLLQVTEYVFLSRAEVAGTKPRRDRREAATLVLPIGLLLCLNHLTGAATIRLIKSAAFCQLIKPTGAQKAQAKPQCMLVCACFLSIAQADWCRAGSSRALRPKCMLCCAWFLSVDQAD